MTHFEKIIKTAIKEWSEQGRDKEHIYAVNNFMTGRGLKMIDEIKSAVLRDIKEGEICLNCGNKKEGKLIDRCVDCLENE